MLWLFEFSLRKELPYRLMDLGLPLYALAPPLQFALGIV